MPVKKSTTGQFPFTQGVPADYCHWCGRDLAPSDVGMHQACVQAQLEAMASPLFRYFAAVEPLFPLLPEIVLAP